MRHTSFLKKFQPALKYMRILFPPQLIFQHLLRLLQCLDVEQLAAHYCFPLIDIKLSQKGVG